MNTRGMNKTESRLLNDGIDGDGAVDDMRGLLWRALAGDNLSLDRDVYSLHDLTQLALALQPDATLAIRHADSMTPLERASIATVGRGRVVFV